MVARNNLLEAPPYGVEQALRNVGRNLRLARLRRKKTMQEMAERIGTGVRAVREAENGKVSTSAGVYAALLWAYDLLSPLNRIADPREDKEGLALAAAKESQRARKGGGLDSDF